jgi:hypothetical protein
MGESVAIGGFESRALLYLRSGLHLRSGLPREAGTFTAGAFTDDELLGRLHSCVERCADYGLTTESQIFNFTAASCLLGEDFDADPENDWVADVLNDPEASPDERAALLLAIAATIFEDATTEDAAVEVAAAEDSAGEEATVKETGGA